MQVLLAPHVSEKSTLAGRQANQVVFRVALMRPSPRSARRSKAVRRQGRERHQWCAVKGKRKRFGRLPGRRSDWKKAYVRPRAWPGN
jgi:large subunit ribosomal protein L23